VIGDDKWWKDALLQGEMPNRDEMQQDRFVSDICLCVIPPPLRSSNKT
jgi:hypothetical protein